MLKQLTDLSILIGEYGDDDIKKALRDLVAVLPTRPDAERAALMLLSAGQAMYGNSELDEDWLDAVAQAEKLLGIVELTPAV